MSSERQYRTVMGSDVANDGMYLELWDCETDRLALWAFYSDADGSFKFERYMSNVSAEVELWFQAEAQRRLPPIASESQFS